MWPHHQFEWERKGKKSKVIKKYLGGKHMTGELELGVCFCYDYDKRFQFLLFHLGWSGPISVSFRLLPIYDIQKKC